MVEDVDPFVRNVLISEIDIPIGSTKVYLCSECIRYESTVVNMSLSNEEFSLCLNGIHGNNLEISGRRMICSPASLRCMRQWWGDSSMKKVINLSIVSWKFRSWSDQYKWCSYHVHGEVYKYRLCLVHSINSVRSWLHMLLLSGVVLWIWAWRHRPSITHWIYLVLFLRFHSWICGEEDLRHILAHILYPSVARFISSNTRCHLP